jgi:hypothetical protein
MIRTSIQKLFDVSLARRLDDEGMREVLDEDSIKLNAA